MTRSAMRDAGTPSPTATMRPTMSVPWMRGKLSVALPPAPAPAPARPRDRPASRARHGRSAAPPSSPWESPIAPDSRVLASSSEVVGVGKQSRRATGMDEHDRLVLCEPALPDQADQARHRLAAIDRVEEDSLEPRQQCHRLDHAGIRHAVARRRIAAPDLERVGGYLSAQPDLFGAIAGDRADFGQELVGLAVDVDAENGDAGLRQRPCDD